MFSDEMFIYKKIIMIFVCTFANYHITIFLVLQIFQIYFKFCNFVFSFSRHKNKSTIATQYTSTCTNCDTEIERCIIDILFKLVFLV